MKTDILLSSCPIISDQVDARELKVLLYELESQLQRGMSGSVVEFGCYVGTTSLFIRRLLDAYNSTAEYHVYDSFEGLPEKSAIDESCLGRQFKAGELLARKKDLVGNFKKANLHSPVIHKNWFNQLESADTPQSISFAFLDGDYYESIRDSLRHITHKLTESAVIIVDDYANEALPGVARAVDEWRRLYPHRLRIQASLAVIK
ncbi:hypothetical protein EOL96_00930 [Candidatus Saccharibacteria bacterium]|nr:hypothetical protein [Candidatus Saccharibacteria bacterium]